MSILLLIFFTLLGAIIGSFLNVVILRYNTGLSLGGRSGCMSCGKTLQWYELIPIISYIIIRGRCTKCSSKISIQYPLVELSTAILFGLTFILFNTSFLENIVYFGIIFALYLIALSILVVIFVYDIYHKIIPDSLSYSFAVVALSITLITIKIPIDGISGILNLFSGIILFLPFYILWLVSKGKWIGLGDGKLALGIGWLLGIVHGVSALVIAFWIGAIFSVCFMLLFNLKHKAKNITMKTEIPFAPFLIIGTLIELFFRIDIFGLGTLFF